MNSLIRSQALFLMLTIASLSFAAEDDAANRIAELDAYWSSVSQAVSTGDFDRYAATFHQDAVLVSERSKTSYPISTALAKWKSGFQDTKHGKLQAKVEFRFSQRFGDATTAHETGIFHYSTKTADGKETSAHIHFEALLIKKDGKWLAMMEYQKSAATKKQWELDSADSNRKQ